MLIKGLEPNIKTIEAFDENNVPYVIEKIIGYNSYKLEVDNIQMFREVLHPKTKKPYKKRSYLFTQEGWILVNHSMDELQKFKEQLHKIVKIKGFGK